MTRYIGEAFYCLLRTDWLMRRGGVPAIHDTLRKTLRQPIRSSHASAEELCRAVDIACVLYWKRALCLQRSAATALLLRHHQHPADLVIGAQVLPFKAHAWVELRGQVINDVSYISQLYRELRDAEATDSEKPMSVIFGVCAPQDSIVDRRLLLRLADATSRYGIDGTVTHAQGRIGMGFQAFHTHSRSRLDCQPVIDSLGNALVFDGRLDNHRDLSARLGIEDDDVSDSSLVLQAFTRWGYGCFSSLVGDWALALWSVKESALYLARDHAGARTLFYQHKNGETRWSTYLEAFFIDGHTPTLNPEYVARILSSQRIFVQTPYAEIWAVLPAHYVVIRDRNVSTRPHWRWIADREIVYASDGEYDEHFLHLFRAAVGRRTGSGGSVLAQLSGGMDSTSIVCVADELAKGSAIPSTQIDTISYYNDTEPNWDERQYFVAVEKHRQRTGTHIDSSSRVPCFEPLELPDRVYPYPGGDRSSLGVAMEFEQSLGPGRYRAIVSGVGGDELLGGIPTPMPELANHLRAGRLLRLISQASKWCVTTREPIVHLLGTTILYTKSLYRPPHITPAIPPWLMPGLRELCADADHLSTPLGDLLTARPSAIANGEAWWRVLESLPHLTPHLVGCYEYRYPYLDRELVEFLHRIPREQLVQPGRRRFLMRRALRGIVPEEILERKRKAYQSRGLIAALRDERQAIEHLFVSPLCSRLGFVDRNLFLLALRADLAGDPKWIEALMRTIRLELWLRSFEAVGVSLHVSPGHPSPEILSPVISRATKLRDGVAGS